MLPQCLHGAVKRLDRPIGARKHDATFHDGKHIRCQRFDIGFLWQSCRLQTLANGANPPMEVFRDELVCWTTNSATHSDSGNPARTSVSQYQTARLFHSPSRNFRPSAPKAC